ncbi:M15 family metallopeptidase [Streptomyces sp. NPDC059009]|uniref:M15 family metallopeptidase n=1 Tax=Streptomyces sp. NPDC059009 TaxID=3346694 RepID=UPI00369A5E05
MREIILMSDPRVAAVPVQECGERLVDVRQESRLLADTDGRELDLGTPMNASPEESSGTCYTGAPGVSATARRHRGILGAALESAGLVNYPTEWWHWSFGDRYWALQTGAPAALYGPVER